MKVSNQILDKISIRVPDTIHPSINPSMAAKIYSKTIISFPKKKKA
jgi:hypothetical protein